MLSLGHRSDAASPRGGFGAPQRGDIGHGSPRAPGGTGYPVPRGVSTETGKGFVRGACDMDGDACSLVSPGKEPVLCLCIKTRAGKY